MILALLSLIAAIACYSISQLLNHGKFRWSKKGLGFWDDKSDLRKYKMELVSGPGSFSAYLPVIAPDNFYYKYIARVKYRERWFTSTNLTVSFTDSYHAMQSLSFIFLSLTLALLYGFSYIVWGSCWLLIVCTHSVVYHLLSKKP